MAQTPLASLTLPSSTRAGELEERLAATRRLAWIGVIAWSLFVVTDFADAAISHRPHILIPLLELRGAGIAVALTLLAVLRRPRISRRAVATCDVVFFVTGSVLIALEGALVGGFASQIVQGIMILAFMRASLLPSHWMHAFAVSTAAALAFPLTIVVASMFDADVRRGWLSPEPATLLAYAMVQIIAGVAIGSAGSHMVWRARRQVHEARKLGSYRLKARIGSGTTGDVWLARQDPLGRDVALKVLKTPGLGDEESRRRFAREAKAASRLRHPNTIRIIEFGASDDGVFFIAMELLDGVSLDALVAKGGPVAPARAIHLAMQACSSLVEAHDAGIVHRDIKPANFFLARAANDEDYLKLLDFGVAQMIDAEAAALVTHTGTLVGTPAYMAPEACAGERVDARSDLYSLGAVLYYMLTGTDPFPDRTVAETLNAHMMLAPEPPSVRLASRGGSIAPDLEAVVLRCLRKRREDRFTSARDLEDALRACCDHEGEDSRRRSGATSRRLAQQHAHGVPHA